MLESFFPSRHYMVSMAVIYFAGAVLVGIGALLIMAFIARPPLFPGFILGVIASVLVHFRGRLFAFASDIFGSEDGLRRHIH